MVLTGKQNTVKKRTVHPPSLCGSQGHGLALSSFDQSRLVKDILVDADYNCGMTTYDCLVKADSFHVQPIKHQITLQLTVNSFSITSIYNIRSTIWTKYKVKWVKSI